MPVRKPPPGRQQSRPQSDPRNPRQDLSDLAVSEKLDLILKSLQGNPKSTSGRKARRSGFKDPVRRAEKEEGRKEKLVSASSSFEGTCSPFVGMGADSYE